MSRRPDHRKPNSAPPRRRAKIVRHRRFRDPRPPAQSPGSLVHVGERREADVHFHIIDYDSAKATELRTDSIAKCLAFEDVLSPTWIRVIGLHDVAKIAGLLKRRGVHPLIQDDVLNTNQRPKVELVDKTVFTVIKLLVPEPAPEDGYRIESLSLLLSENLVVTFHESDSGLFEPVLKRLRDGKGLIRSGGSDYLFWAILDAAVDNYFLVLNQVEDEIDRLDTQLIDQDGAFEPSDLHRVKQDTFHLYRIIRPMRELVASLSKLDTPLVTPSTHIFLRDLYDHAIHAIEITESLREAANSLRDYQASAVSLRMNEIMKVLTAFSTIFLPLTFLAGVYGMNFKHMPELEWAWAYPALWGVFMLVSLGMFVYFRRRNWL